jgi:adenylate cyclase
MGSDREPARIPPDTAGPERVSGNDPPAAESLGGLVRDLFRSAGESDLPPRVRQRIREQQTASELLAGWIQLLVVLGLGLLYALSPKTFSADEMFAPVPWALAGFLAVTLVRLVRGYRRPPCAAFSGLFCVADMVLLFLLIWSFHIQYEQPPAFILKAPTLFYVFLFIALRALLLEPWLVMLAGGSAAVGWLVVVVAVLLVDDRAGLITRSYIEYLTSSRLLVGAEVDKIVVILVATGLIGVAVRRARTLLVRAVADGVRARDLARFFAPEVAARITSGEMEAAPGRGEGREAAILYLDIQGFTAMASAMPAEELIGLLAEYQARLVPPVLEHGGTAEKYLGDGMMAAFGAVVRREAYAADALRAAEGILAVADAWNVRRIAAGQPPIGVRIAVSAGPVVVGAVGGEARLEYAVVGHPVNLAAKLEKHAKIEGVRALCTREAHERALAQGWQPRSAPELRPARSVAGVAEPVDLVMLSP